MSVKIFLPLKLFYKKENCDIFGEIQINEDNTVSYFILASSECSQNGFQTQRKMRHLGQIISAGSYAEMQHKDVSVLFAYDADTPNIYLCKLSIQPRSSHINVYLFEPTKLMQLKIPANTTASKSPPSGSCSTRTDEVSLLSQLLNQKKDFSVTQQIKVYNFLRALGQSIYFPVALLSIMFESMMYCRAVSFLTRKTSLHEHFTEWIAFRNSGKRNINLILDKLLGCIVMILLLFYFREPRDYLTHASQVVITYLRLLLRALIGNPVGLKLNIHLNNFLLDCFNYHIDLWATFLNLIDPFVQKLYVPIALQGLLGFSFQLALFADLLSLISVHAHCFYIYSAVLYKVEIKGLQVLWKVMLGKRYNVLKNRVETHNYKNRQLYLATIFFSILLFLFPTIIVYYIVFTTLRLCSFIANLILQTVRRHLLEFPLQDFFKWLSGNFYDIESLQLQYLSDVPSPLFHGQNTQLSMCIFRIKVKSSSLGNALLAESGVLKGCLAQKITIKTIVQEILQGVF